MLHREILSQKTKTKTNKKKTQGRGCLILHMTYPGDKGYSSTITSLIIITPVRVMVHWVTHEHHYRAGILKGWIQYKTLPPVLSRSPLPKGPSQDSAQPEGRGFKTSRTTVSTAHLPWSLPKALEENYSFSFPLQELHKTPLYLVVINQSPTGSHF